MDRPDVSGAPLDRALAGLGVVHRRLGGSRCVLRALAYLRGRGLPDKMRILDVGCGGGELAVLLDDWAHVHGQAATSVLVDFNRHTCRRARELTRGGQSIVVQADAFSLPFSEKSFDIVHFGLFLHHFDSRQLADILRRTIPLCRCGLIVSDLRRHWLPYLAVRWGSRLVASEMVQHDGPLSVRRGFDHSDLEEAAETAGFRWTMLQRVWPYRWLAVKCV